jgi:hypothetical protein
MHIKKKQNRLSLLDSYIRKSICFCCVGIHLKIQLHPTEPANCTGPYTSVREEIADTEIAMHQGLRTILVTTMMHKCCYHIIKQ